MSVTISVIRCVSVVQVDVYDQFFDGLKPYQYYEVISHGWTGGARLRSKKFSSIEKIQQWLNKLLAGNWIDDSTYDKAWGFTLSLSALESALNDHNVQQAVDSAIDETDIWLTSLLRGGNDVH